MKVEDISYGKEWIMRLKDDKKRVKYSPQKYYITKHVQTVMIQIKKLKQAINF